MPKIELITLISSTQNAVDESAWLLGPQQSCAPNPAAVAAALEVCEADTDAVLVFDGALPLPPTALLSRLLDGPADVWHAGLRLGIDGQPSVLDHVQPLWMHNARVDPEIEASSWRVTLRALLVRRTVLEQLGGPDPAFDTLTGSALHMGRRWAHSGALVRHVPSLVPDGSPADPPPSPADGLRLVARRDGRAWATWALARSVVTRSQTLPEAARSASVLRVGSDQANTVYQPPSPTPGSTDRSVSVVLPTVDRYDYLIPLLGQLAAQTVLPHQVLIVDQTPKSHRRHDLADIEPRLAVTVFDQDEPGQSTARNRALAAATGELILFIDDDDEIGPEVVADHLRRIVDGIDASSGGVDDATAGPPPVGFRHRRLSDTFPTNNTMVRRSALERSGWFDPAFDRGPRADHDLGMRLHLSGALLVYDPAVMVFHHHAPAGGLRTHGARAVTRASSRRSLTQRDLPTATQLALGHRYYNARQRREGKAITVASAMSADGGRARRLLRAVVQVALLPSSLRRIAAAERQAALIGPPPSPRSGSGVDHAPDRTNEATPQ